MRYGKHVDGGHRTATDIVTRMTRRSLLQVTKSIRPNNLSGCKESIRKNTKKRKLPLAAQTIIPVLKRGQQKDQEFKIIWKNRGAEREGGRENSRTD